MLCFLLLGPSPFCRWSTDRLAHCLVVCVCLFCLHTPQPVELSELEQLQQELPEARDPPPTVEWWDKPLLEGGVYYTPRAQEQQQQQGEGAEAGPGSQKEQQAEASLDPEAGECGVCAWRGGRESKQCVCGGGGAHCSRAALWSCSRKQATDGVLLLL